MKNLLVAGIALLILSGTVHAQKFHPGIKGGLNTYTLLGDHVVDFTPKISYHLGVLAHIHMGDKFGLQPEIIFSGQGARYENSEVALRLKYINVPLLAQYMFGDGFRLQAGPQLGILASAQTVINDSKTDVKTYFRGADLGLALGMSYVNSASGLGFDLRYNQGLTNINDSGPYSSFNTGLQLGVFYLFGH